ncbi:ABC transporter ATP-binding protein [Clostridia bacterium]|nr:ABC transporter ATP-binding protein [Clostridia bacterium]
MNDELIKIENLDVNFRLKGKLFAPPDVISAVNAVSLSIRKNESFGVVGESGCGKSTLANAILGFVKPDRGRIFYKGQDLLTADKKAFLSLRSGMQTIFQDPYSSLNPRMPVWALISEPLYIRGERDKTVLKARALELLRRVGLGEEDMDRAAPCFSGGQRQRIVIARALALQPEFIICDEPLSALDVSVHAQICNLLQDLRKELRLTYLFISHNLAVVRHMTERMAVMYLGRVVEYGDTEKIYKNPCHPYTRALLSAVPEPDVGGRPPELLRGEVASPINPPAGCRFQSRCAYAKEDCAARPDGLFEAEPEHFTACCMPLLE